MSPVSVEVACSKRDRQCRKMTMVVYMHTQWPNEPAEVRVFGEEANAHMYDYGVGGPVHLMLLLYCSSVSVPCSVKCTARKVMYDTVPVDRSTSHEESVYTSHV